MPTTFGRRTTLAFPPWEQLLAKDAFSGVSNSRGLKSLDGGELHYNKPSENYHQGGRASLGLRFLATDREPLSPIRPLLRYLPHHGSFPSFVSTANCRLMPLQACGPSGAHDLDPADQTLVDLDTKVSQERHNISSSGVPTKLAQRMSDGILLARAVGLTFRHDERPSGIRSTRHMEHGNGLALGFIPLFDGIGRRNRMYIAAMILEEALGLVRQL